MCTGTAILGRTKRKGRFALHAAVFASAAFVAPIQIANAQCQYEVSAVLAGWPCGEFGSTAPLIPTSMNSTGMVGGYILACAGPVTRAFYWTEDAGIVLLDHPPNVYASGVSGMNDTGLLTGWHTFTNAPAKGWVYDLNNPDAGFTYLEPLYPDVWVTTASSVNAVNNSGIAVGSRTISKPGEPQVYNAVIWNTKTGEVIDLGVMKGPNSWANAVTDNSDVAGSMGSSIPSSAWVYIDGVLTVLGPIPGGTTSTGFAINASREVAVGGWLKNNPDGLLTQGAIWRDFEWHMLPLLPGANSGGPTEINNLGQAGGSVGFPPNPASNQKAVLWQHGMAHDLNALVDLGDDLNLWTVRGMDDEGRILTRATHKGRSVAAVLTPVNRPLTDLNADCVTDVHDLLMLLSAWGPCDGAACPADFNGDGKVDVLDLLILLDNWGMPRKEVPR